MKTEGVPEVIPIAQSLMNKMNFKKQINLKGFTLIEVLIVLAIIVALAILVIAGYQEGRPRLAVDRASAGLASDLEIAKQRSISNVYYQENGDNFFGENHGVLIDKNENKYYLTAYNKEGEKIIRENVEIERVVDIFELSPDDGGSLEIWFDKEETYFNGTKAGQEDVAEIVFLGKTDESIRKKVVIDYSGVIEIIQEYE